MARHKHEKPEDEATDTEQPEPGADYADAIAALGAKIRSELGPMVEAAVESLRSELRFSLEAGLDAIRRDCRPAEAGPTAREVFEASYPHKVPRILHKGGKEQRVNTVAECEDALADGWHLLPR